jgi:hypothetical protein
LQNWVRNHTPSFEGVFYWRNKMNKIEKRIFLVLMTVILTCAAWEAAGQEYKEVWINGKSHWITVYPDGSYVERKPETASEAPERPKAIQHTVRDPYAEKRPDTGSQKLQNNQEALDCLERMIEESNPDD